MSKTALLLVAMAACAAASAAAPEPLVRVAVPLRMGASLGELDRMLLEVSDPASPRFGRYLSREELAGVVGAGEASIEAASAWLRERLGAVRVQVAATRDALVAAVPRSRVAHSTHPDGADLFAAGEPLDQRAAEAVEFVRVVRGREPAPMSGAERKAHLARAAGPGDSSAFGDPHTQLAAYGVPAGLNGSHADNRQMVWGPGTYGFLDSDLATFVSEFGLGSSAVQPTRLGSAGKPGGDNFFEASLDTDVIVGLGAGVATVVANTNTSQSAEEGTGFGPALLDFTLLLGNMSDADLPRVVSMSLGSLTYDSCSRLCASASAASGVSVKECLNHVQHETRQVCMFPSGPQEARIDAEFAKLGLRGVSLLAASGDGGSHYSFQPFSGDSALVRALNDASCALNSPTYPSASPYVTAVGGITWGGSASPQDPAAWGPSGGGFSWRFAMPAYQREVVGAYLAAHGNATGFPAASGFNAKGRAYPDVASLATQVPMVADGQTIPAGGTSAAAPSFSGLVSLLNGVRLRAGLPVLGFLNPRIYKVGVAFPGEAFYDTVSGTSACNSAGTCCATGFVGAAGWDPLTGFGSPVWAGLAKHFGTDSTLRRQ